MPFFKQLVGVKITPIPCPKCGEQLKLCPPENTEERLQKVCPGCGYVEVVYNVQ